MRRFRERRVRVLGAAVLGLSLALSGCVTHSDSESWSIEPISFRTTLDAELGTTAGEPQTDIAFGMSVVSGDGAGGFWATSGGSWLHVDDRGDTAARFNVEPGSALARVAGMAAFSASALVVATERPTGLWMLDTETMALQEVPFAADDPAAGPFADVAVYDGELLAVRFVYIPQAYVDYEVVRVDPDDGTARLLHRESLELPDGHPDDPSLPHIDIDVDASGRIFVATPTARLTLDADGTLLSRVDRAAERPLVAVQPDGDALWWGGSSSEGTAPARIDGGSADARAAIERRGSCESPLRDDDLEWDADAGARPLGFLCGANSAAWIGDAWLVAVGGEADGVLVRVTPPQTP